jgi:hypothetical protein
MIFEWFQSLCIFILFLLFLCINLFAGSIKNIQENWAEYRCNPIMMPFAGYIMPIPGKTNGEVTYDNVRYCIKKDASEVFSIALLPLEFALYVMVEFLDNIEEGIRSVMATIRYILNKIIT